MDKTILTGFLGRDVEPRAKDDYVFYTGSIAISKGKDKEGVRITKWVDFILGGNRFTKVSQHLKKGTHVLLEGELNINTYLDKNTGKDVSKLSLNGFNVELLSGMKDKEEATNEENKTDGIPF